MITRDCPRCGRQIVHTRRISKRERGRYCRKCYQETRLSESPLNSVIGQTINNNLIIDRAEEGNGSEWYWIAECMNCGIRKEKLLSQIRNSHTCGCQTCGGLPKGEAGLGVLYRRYKDRAIREKRAFSLSLEEFRTLTSSDCYYCGLPPMQIATTQTYLSDSAWGSYKYNGIDRKNNDFGYLINNCAPCCWDCNQAKKAKSYENFVAWLDRVTSFRSLPRQEIVPSSHFIQMMDAVVSKNGQSEEVLQVQSDCFRPLASQEKG